MVEVEWQARKEPQERTRWLEVRFPAGKPPAFLEDLKGVGFEPLDFRMPPAFEGVEKLWLTKPGSDLFQGWTEEEAAQYIRDVRRVLRHHGITRIPFRRLGYAEMR